MKIYPDQRIKLKNAINDPHKVIPAGAEGKVSHVDDLGTIHVSWDKYGYLGVLPHEDDFEILPNYQDATTNINHYVGVKLTEEGIQILVDRHTELYNKLLARKANTTLRDPVAYKEDLLQKIKENDGYYKTQMWMFIDVFAEYFRMGLELPFDANLIFYKVNVLGKD